MCRKIADLLWSHKILIIAGIAITSLIIWYIMTNSRNNEIVLIEGPRVPVKVKPATNGIDVPHQDKEIYQSLTTMDNDDPVSNEQIIDENEAPMQVASQIDDKADSPNNNDSTVQEERIDEIAQLATKSEAALSAAK
jgi:hypothetical protein